MKILCTAFLFFTALFMAACGGDEQSDRFPGYEQHASGVYFKKHKTGTGKVSPSDSDYVFLSLRYTTEKDSMFNDNGGRMMSTIVRKPLYKGDFYQLIRDMKVGDSITFMMSVDSLREFYKLNDFPAYIDTNGYIGYAVRLDSVLTKAEWKAEETSMRNLVVNDSALLAKFIQDRGITAKPDEFGLYVIESVKGAGAEVKPGMVATVKYKGYYLNGKEFDSGEYAFPVGMQQVIPGWDMGIPRMRVGSKGMLIVPPSLGYRDGLTRVFDVEILNAQAGPAGMPQAPRGR